MWVLIQELKRSLQALLGGVMGHRHDPCVLTLMSVQHFLESGEALPWWTFTGEGKKLLATTSGAGTRLV